MKKKIKDLLFGIDTFVFAWINLKALRSNENRRELREIIRGVARLKKKSRFSIGADMFVKCLCSAALYSDYSNLCFYDLSLHEVLRLLTYGRNIKVNRSLRSPEVRDLLNDKIHYLTAFRAFTKRDFFGITDSTSPNDLESFTSLHRAFIAKPGSLNRGQGVELVDSRSFPDTETLLSYLRGKQTLLLEERVKNHPDLMKYSEQSLNTIRIISVRTEEGVKLINAFLKFNTQGDIADNRSPGYNTCQVDLETGELIRGMTSFRDLAIRYLPYHPKGFAFEGEQIPFWREAISLATEAMLALQDAYYVGWDIAITAHGPIVIEGNNNPSYEWQRYSRSPVYKEIKSAYRFAKKRLR